ncbi:protein-disulfide reductase DsbD family protein [Flavivirga amylovorans]|uniref:Protein-disulfide reductase DsbD family protein n=1 Tax=Flavivirga amylovorans TaxID=870486 RepID=A0ABT8WWE9_9FLAO|nr:protein-disulfide reductase DsbD domain-containing protein [Flavivirga amylovorans]MDO5985822.1 protein-disulfide reductase DsbD family protein [Flavivirga amylovorans]
MRFNRNICLVLLIIVQFSFSQTAKVLPDLNKKVETASSELSTSPTNPVNPVSINATLVWSDDKSQLAIIQKVNIADEWHIYAYVPENQPYIASKLKLKLPGGIKTIGDWETPYSEPYGDGIYVYHGTLVFVQYCSVGNYTKAAEISCGLFYQTCDRYKCFPPKNKTKKLKLNF